VEDMKIQNIPQSQRTYAELLVPFYGEKTPCLMYAQKWKHRETGVQEFTQGMNQALTQAASTGG